MFAKPKRMFLLLGVTLSLSTSSTASQKCESEVAAHLKPVKEDSGLSWAMELTGQLGYLGGSELDRGLASGMVFLGLHYRPDLSSPHQFYFEGGYKDWYKTDDGPGLGGTGTSWGGLPTPAKDHWGLREAYYDFGGKDTGLTAGLHTASLGETLLLDERAVGLSLERTFGSYTLQVATGSVMTQFAKMKDFCATRHVYRIVRGGRINSIGDRFGETNFVGGVFAWSPDATDEPYPVGTSGEGQDEFVTLGDDFSALEESKEGLVQRVGAILFEELGPGFVTDRLYYGGIAELRVLTDFELRVEVIHQHVTDNRTVGYLIQGERDFTWKSGALTSLYAGYIGSATIDPNARFAPAFSNLFLGEVMRMDVINLPLVFGRVKHTTTWKGKPVFGVFVVGQTSGSRAEEYDFEAELRLSRGLRLYGVLGFVRSAALPDTTMVGRVQMRYAF